MTLILAGYDGAGAKPGRRSGRFIRLNATKIRGAKWAFREAAVKLRLRLLCAVLFSLHAAAQDAQETHSDRHRT